MLVQVINDRVGAGIERVSGQQSSSRSGRGLSGVQGFDGADGGAADVVEVEDGRFGVEAGGMETVAVAHGDARKGVEVPRRDRGLHLPHARGHNRVGPGLEQARGLHRRLHPRRAAHPLFGRAYHQDQRPHLGPMAPGCHQSSYAVEPVFLRAVVPRHVAA